MHLKSAEKMIREGFGIPLDGIEVPELDSSNSWIVIGTSHTFQPVKYQSISHWMPGWHRKQLGEERWELLKASLRKQIVEQMSANNATLLQAVEQDEDLLDSLLDQQKELESMEAFVEQVLAQDIFPQNVVGDGNCGALSLLALQDGWEVCMQMDSLARLPKANHKRVMALRKDSSCEQYSVYSLSMYIIVFACICMLHS